MVSAHNMKLLDLSRVLGNFDLINFTLIMENLNKVDSSKKYYNPLFELKTLSLVYGVSVTREDLVAQIKKFEENEFEDAEYDMATYFENQLIRTNDKMIQNLISNVYNSGNLTITDVDTYIELCEQELSGYGRSYVDVYTPTSVNLLMGKLVDLKNEESIYDCASGTGSSLLPIISESNKVYSQELNPTESLRQALLYKLLGLNNTVISSKSSLSEPMIGEEMVDKAISCPPFGLKVFEEVNELVSTVDKNVFSANRDASIYFYNLLTKTVKNKAVFVAPSGLLFKSSKFAYAFKEWILKSNYLEAVIQLPVGIFAPVTNVSTAMIVINKKKKNNGIMMIDLSESEYITRDRRTVNLIPEEMDKLCQLVENQKEIPGLSVCISMNDIDSENLNLTPSNYLSIENEKIEKVDFASLIKERELLLKEINIQSEKVNKLIDILKGDD